MQRILKPTMDWDGHRERQEWRWWEGWQHRHPGHSWHHHTKSKWHW